MIQADSAIDHEGQSAWPSKAGMAQRGLIVIALFSLTISLATRYCVSTASSNHPQTTATSHAPSPKRQHLVSDGLHWTAPSSTFTLFEPGPARSVLLPPFSPITSLYIGSSLHNRPPPFC